MSNGISSDLTSTRVQRRAKTKYGVFKPLGDALTGPLQLEIKQLIAEGDKVVSEMQGTSQSAGGKDYNNTYCVVLTLRDGKITEMREYLDTELLTAVFG